MDHDDDRAGEDHGPDRCFTRAAPPFGTGQGGASTASLHEYRVGNALSGGRPSCVLVVCSARALDDARCHGAWNTNSLIRQELGTVQLPRQSHTVAVGVWSANRATRRYVPVP